MSHVVQGGVQLVEESKEKAHETNVSEVKEKTKEVAHKVKHHGGWGEDLLGKVKEVTHKVKHHLHGRRPIFTRYRYGQGSHHADVPM